MVYQSTLQINGTTIAVKQSGSGDDVILFVHGSCMDSDIWLPQLTNTQLNKRYRLIAFDLPGHGGSGWYRDNPAGYRPGKMALLIKDILDKCSVKRFLLVGLSLGTIVIGEISPPLKGCAGILLESACIVNGSFPVSVVLTPVANGHVMIVPDPDDVELNDYIFNNARGKQQGEQYLKTYKNTDPAFREELGKTIMESALTDEIRNIKEWNLPVCVVYGRDETLINTGYLNTYEPLWNQQVYFIEEAAHIANEDQPDKFNGLLLSFADKVFK